MPLKTGIPVLQGGEDVNEIVNITDRERAKDRLIAQLSAGRDALAARLDKVRADRLDLKRSNEALEADAARYRQLRRGQHWSIINGIGDELRAETLDAAIDAAMKGHHD